MSFHHELNHAEVSLSDRLRRINWSIVVLLCGIASIGFVMLYSAASGSMTPWAVRQIARFVVGLIALLIVALVDLRLLMRLAYPAYLGALALLGLVELVGVMGGSGAGAQRWLNLGVMQLQPSEPMKIALVVGLARYFHGLEPEEVGRPTALLIPLLMIGAPGLLVIRQPDLGTAVVLALIGGAMFWLAGVRMWQFLVLAIGAVVAVPIGWSTLAPYQQDRVLTFLNPESDPLGAGYHIMQSKIALGSGGLFGRGFLQGSQSHLNFLPEKQTDFIFTMLAEEFGLIGGLTLLALYALLIAYAIGVGLRSRSQFGRLLATGVGTALFLYVFINIAMVMGLLPVVGVPLPLISYGGSALLTVLVGFGLVINVDVNRDLMVNAHGRTI